MLNQTLHNRYTLTALIGSGAMGTVYRATDSQTGEDVAVKLLNRELAFSPELLERFRREGEALRQLRHPNIVGFVDTFQHDPDPSGGAGGQQVIVMEYVAGGSLHSLIKQGPLSIDHARKIALGLCDALTRAHDLGIIHRDLKPENILVAADGTPKLTDFGIARLLTEGTRITHSGVQVGTPYYMSPEAWEGKPLDAQADIWSLGIVLFEMLAGAVPFPGDTVIAVMHKVLTAPLPELKQLRPDAPDGLARIVGHMMTRDKAARYETMREVGLDLERGSPLVIPAAVPAPPAKPAKRAPRWAWGVAAVLVIVGLVAGAIILGPKLTSGELAVAQPSLTPEPILTPIQQATHVPPVTPRSTNTPAPTYTPGPLDNGQILEECNDGLCLVGYRGGGIQLDLGAKFPSIEGYSWSPDGSRIVFAACPLDEMAGQSSSGCALHLYIVNGDGSNLTELLRLPSDGTKLPAWSPDGEWIAYMQSCGLRIIRPNGTAVKTLVASGSNGLICPNAIAWSPNSQRIAWTGGRWDASSNKRIWVIARDGTGLQTIYQSPDLQFANGESNIVWSPDGKSVAARFENGDVYLFDAECNSKPGGCGDSSRTLTNDIPVHWLDNFYPQWAGEDVSR